MALLRVWDGGGNSMVRKLLISVFVSNFVDCCICNSFCTSYSTLLYNLTGGNMYNLLYHVCFRNKVKELNKKLAIYVASFRICRRNNHFIWAVIPARSAAPVRPMLSNYFPCFFSILVQASRKVTVRLKTGRSDSGWYPRLHKNNPVVQTGSGRPPGLTPIPAPPLL
jgi:hypothetical protein